MKIVVMSGHVVGAGVVDADTVQVTARFDQVANDVEFDVPTEVARKFSIGRKLELTVSPARKPRRASE